MHRGVKFQAPWRKRPLHAGIRKAMTKQHGVLLLSCLSVFVAVLVLVAQGLAEVDAHLIGAWAANPTGGGANSRPVWEFREDGTYTYDSYDGHAGDYTADNGQLTLTARQRAWPHITPPTMHVAYSFDGTGSLRLEGLGGPSDWTRVTSEVNFMTRKVGAQYIPENLPVVVARTLLTVAQPWRQDAIPVWLQVSSLPSGMFGVELYFVSPADNAGLRIDLHKFTQKVSESRRVNWGVNPLPVDFLDLPEVLEIVGRSGAAGSLEKAGLRQWERGHRAWVLNVNNKGVAVDAVTGKPIRGEMSNYAANYNAQWAKAAEGIRRLLQKENPSDKVSCAAVGAWWQHDKCYYKRREEIAEEQEADCVRKGGRWSFGTCFDR